METLNLYDGLIGRWEAEAQAFLPDGTARRHFWDIHFERALGEARWHRLIEMLAHRISSFQGRISPGVRKETYSAPLVSRESSATHQSKKDPSCTTTSD